MIDSTKTSAPLAGPLALQLMVSAGLQRRWGAAAILQRLQQALQLLAPQELLLAIHEPDGALARDIVATCAAAGTRVCLWTMVLADRPSSWPALPPALDAGGHGGHGRAGAWSGLGQGEEQFLFACPGAVADDRVGAALAVETARALGADGLFLDRIRLPSPANGLEALGTCACPRCREAYRSACGQPWPDLHAWAVESAHHGAAGARRFLEHSATARRFRSERVGDAVRRYASAARSQGMRVGLDVFAPSLAPLVGQDLAALLDLGDFVKPMLYSQAWGPAGLPLEQACLLAGLTRSGVAATAARAFVSAITGTPDGELEAVARGQSLPVAAVRRELLQLDALGAAVRAGPELPTLYAGIEFVDHEDYATRIDDTRCAELLDAVGTRPLAVCWNLLHVPLRHLERIAEFRKGRD